jgi:formylglycine-generating enzyme required for sulfatase activity
MVAIPGGRAGGGLAIAAKEVTVGDFLRFRKELPYAANRSWAADCPVTGVTWFEAAAYCNWLSRREGIPPSQWCYVDGSLQQPDVVATVVGLLTPTSVPIITTPALVSRTHPTCGGLRPRRDYLSCTGYRLPTEAEWEFACRAGAATRWSFGDAEERLTGRYAWCYGNPYAPTVSRPYPVGTLRPNDLGLFDMHGNACEWCQDPYDRDGGVPDYEPRAIRGGSFFHPMGEARNDSRFGLPPDFSSPGAGFRPARTLR